MDIAVDFDGTIVEHRYPDIGKELPFATATLRRLMKDGHRLMLWSVREGQLLAEAVDWCAERGVHFHTVNANFDDPDPKEGLDPTAQPYYSRKLKADLFIDDTNVGGRLDWGTVYEIVTRKISIETYLMERLSAEEEPRKGFFGRLFSK